MKKLILATILFSSLNLFADTSAADEAALKKINMDIAVAEDKGDRKALESILAPELAFRRANGMVVGREQFLKDVKPRALSKTDIESIQFYGKDRAIVACVVTIKVDGQDTKFHNLRMFIRDGTSWKLLGWANERLAAK